MALKYQGFELECVELYPIVDVKDELAQLTVVLVARGGKTVRVDQVHRRSGGTVYGLLGDAAAMVRHMCQDST